MWTAVYAGLLRGLEGLTERLSWRPCCCHIRTGCLLWYKLCKASYHRRSASFECTVMFVGLSRSEPRSGLVTR